MSDEFEGLIEDGSVSEDIVRLLDETRIWKGDLVNFEELIENVKGKMPNVQEQVVIDDDGDWDDEDDGDEEGDEEEVPRLVDRPKTGHQRT